MTELAERWQRVMAPIYPVPSLELARGKGARVWDTKGRQYLDFLAGIATNALGHAHPAVVDAVAKQVAVLAHTSNLYANEPALLLAEELARLTSLPSVVIVNSGSEANEVALKAMRRAAHAAGTPDGVVVAFENSFHGRTMGALSLTIQPKHHAGFGPLVPGVASAPFNDAAALEAAFERQRVQGVIVEPVQGEGGVRPMEPEFARALGKLCRRHGALLAVDEVQTGLGRTGRVWGHEHFGLSPDILTTAKALGGGLPVGACVMKREVAAHFSPGSHGCTFGGNPVACAASLAALEVIRRDRLWRRAEVAGNEIVSGLADRKIEARGLGLLLGVPVGGPRAADIVGKCVDAGLLIGQAGPDVLRLAPPLIVSDDEVREGVETLGQVLG